MFIEEPIPLIYYDQISKNYKINQDAIEVIKQFEAPLGVASIVGMYRTGKSYLINRMMLNKQKGFGVGPTVNPCTKGLWIWGAPIKGKQQDGSDINILVIDTEGIGALDEDSNHDTRVFSLAILLSSLFVYNSVGSIDENAIQNLSLVISLTKHIQISSQEDEPYSYSNYFPQFLWVVRDFTLQLTDQNQDPITSKQYLENALKIQPGFSDDIDQKNRIRRLIQTFFEDRDCFTMIRPLLDESNLQNVQNLPISTLRAEFNNQIENLRKRYINGMKPKTMNGKQLNGNQFCKLLKSYIEAINNGVIPNIENSWQYICKDENQKVYQIIEEQFVEFMNGLKLPLNQETLKQQYKMKRQDLLMEFQKKAIGDELESYLIDINKLFDQQQEQLFNHNKQQNKLLFDRKIEDGFKHVESSEDLNVIFGSLIQSFGNLRVEDQCKMDIFINKIEQKVENVQKIKDKKNDEIKKKNNEFKVELNQKEGQLQLNEMQINQLEIQIKQFQNNIQEINNQKQQKEQTLVEKLQKEQEINKKLKKENEQLNDDMKDLNRNNLIKISDFEKEQALLNQKLKFQEQNFQDFIDKQQQISNQMNNQKSEIQNQLKQEFQQIEEQNQKLKDQLKDLVITNNDLTVQNQQQQNQIIQDSSNYNTQIQKMNQQVIDLQQQLNKNKDEYQNYQQNNQQSIDELNQAQKQELEELKSKSEKQIQNFKNQEEEFKIQLQNNSNQQAILNQKLQFKQIQYEELENLMTETKRQYESQINALQFKEKQVDNSILLKIKEKHDQEMKQGQDQQDDLRKKLNQQIIELSQKNNDLEFKMKVQQTESEKALIELKDALQQSEDQKNNLKQQNKNIEKNGSQALQETEIRLKKQVKQLQQEIDQLKSKDREQIKIMQESTEKEINELRDLYVEEKVQIEKRLSEQVKKQKQQNQQQQEEFEKAKEEVQSLEEEIENYKQEINNLSIQIINTEQELQNELEIKQNQIVIHEKTIQDMEKQLKQIEEKFNQQIENLKNQNQEENSKLQRILSLRQHEIARIEKEIEQQKQHILQQENTIKNYELTISKDEQELVNHKQKLNNKIKDLEDLNNQKQNEIILLKKENELNDQQVKQKIQFLNDKIKDSQELLEKNVDSLEKNQKITLNKMQDEFNEKIVILQLEKDTTQQKLDGYKKQNKQKQTQMQERITELEKEKHLFQEFRYQSQQKQNELESQYQQAAYELQQQLEKYQQQQQNEQQPIQMEIEKFKRLIEKLETEKVETQSLYERDRILWEQKFIFLNNQKEQSKKDYDEAIKKFDQTLAHMSTIRKNQESEVHQNLGENIHFIEKKYQNQIQEMQEQHENEIETLEDKIRDIQQELQLFKDRIQFEQQMSNQAISEQKYSEIVNNEKRLVSQLNKLKNKDDQSLQQFYKNMEREKQRFNSKIGLDNQESTKQLLKSQDIKSLLNSQKLTATQKIQNFEKSKKQMSEQIQHQVTRSQYGNILSKSIFKDDLSNASQDFNNRYKK